MEQFLDTATALKEESPAISAFWYGKFLQELDRQRQTESERSCSKLLSATIILGRTLQEHTQDATEALNTHQTCLSSGVYALVTSRPSSSLVDHDDLSCCAVRGDETCLINWNKVVLSETECDLGSVAKRLGVVASQLYRTVVGNIEITDLITQWRLHLTWTHNAELFCEAMRLVHSGAVCLSLLLSSAAMERSLGDLFLTVSGAQQCPNLLKDLISSPELEQVLGKYTILSLKAAIGPPSGLNLRNILWHGFVADGEVPQEYAYLLVAMAASIGHTLQHHCPSLTVTHRLYATFLQEPLLTSVFPALAVEGRDLAALQKLFQSSFFVLPSMLSSWLAALHYYRTKCYGHFLCLSLPLMEHGLRRVFACCNGCPDRVLTAESTTLYTTMDEILCPVLSDGVTSNALASELAEGRIEMLLDLFVHPEGPRLRDRVSHGEVLLSDVSASLAGHVLCVCVSLCVQYALSHDPLEDLFVTRCDQIASNYTSIFHPLSILRRELVGTLKEAVQWNDLKPIYNEWHSSEQLMLYEPSKEFQTALEHLQTLLNSTTSPSMEMTSCSSLSSCTQTSSSHPTVVTLPTGTSSLLDLVDQSTRHFECSPVITLIERLWSVRTLFVSRGVLEVVGLLRRTVQHMRTAVTQIRTTVLLRHKLHIQQQLHSRQRTNYQRLLGCLPVYYSAILLIAVMAMAVVTHYPSTTSLCYQQIIRQLKKVLQFAENLSSQTASSRNRWEEAHQLCHSLMITVSKSLPLFHHQTQK